jgi:hypothetical protein
MVTMRSAVVFVSALLVGAFCGAEPPSLPALAPVPLASPAGAHTAEPQFTTQGRHTLLSWLDIEGPHASLKFAERTGAEWSTVGTVVSGTNLMVNSSDVPAVLRLDDGTLVGQWLEQDGPDPESYRLRLSWSRDGGHTWSAPTSPHHDTVETQHGFASLFQASGGGLGLVWLDGRAIKPEAPEGVGNMGLRAATFDAAGKQGGEPLVDPRVCECCPTAAAATSEGVIVAYRNRSAGEIRDIYVTRLAQGRWTPPVAVHNDGWRITGCPVNGPAISARGREVVVAWFNAKGDLGRTFAAFSHDGGRTFGAPIRVDDTSSLGRVGVVMLEDGSAAVTWVEFSADHSTFRVRRVGPTGARGPSVEIADASGTRYPRVAVAGRELLFAWTATEDGVPSVKVAAAPIDAAAR